MTHLIWSTVFLSLYFVGNLVVLPRANPEGWRTVVAAASAASLVLAMIAFGIWFTPIFVGGF
jgi:hypothetical protein